MSKTTMSDAPKAKTPNIPAVYRLEEALAGLEQLRGYLLEQEQIKDRMMDEHSRTMQDYEDRISAYEDRLQTFQDQP